MIQIVRTLRFALDARRCIRRGSAYEDWDAFFDALEAGGPLPPYYREHPLEGRYAGFMECHLGDDVLVIYKRRGVQVILHRAGTHRELFSGAARKPR